jgi:hypothetical protein
MKAKPIQKKSVISIIEITTSPKLSTKANGKATVDARSLSLQQYHTDINKMAKEMEKFALTLSDNLLSIKMALMQSVQAIERRLRENKEKV